MAKLTCWPNLVRLAQLLLMTSTTYILPVKITKTVESVSLRKDLKILIKFRDLSLLIRHPKSGS